MTTLGNKHECFSCEAKFYDLGKSKVVCPTCGSDQADEGAEEVGESPEPPKSKDAPEPDPPPSESDDKPEPAAAKTEDKDDD